MIKIRKTLLCIREKLADVMEKIESVVKKDTNDKRKK